MVPYGVFFSLSTFLNLTTSFVSNQKKIIINEPLKEIKSSKATNIKKPSGNQPTPSTKTNIAFK